MPRRKKMSRQEIYREFPHMRPGNPGYIDVKGKEREERRIFLKNQKKRERKIPLQGDPVE